MDAVMNMFRQRMKLHPSGLGVIEFALVIVLLVCCGQKDKLEEVFEVQSRITGTRKVGPGRCDRLLRRETPRFCQTLKKWEVDIDEIYLPWNVKDTHWVA
ncbi:unnamed protein product [Microthlaspi erraticum]|uniref:Ubiquitin-like protease family profile domain-containing protein n=1 Tax=Microthlaspi erraticum TaxID=1685480 RepID=A0A6D2KYQ4_9BRAS|nr:unnamed protein product [Microthlaspi erraticum]